MYCLKLSNNGTVPYIKCGTTCYIFDEDNNVIREAEIISFEIELCNKHINSSSYIIKYKCRVAGYEDFITIKITNGGIGFINEFTLYTNAECKERLISNDVFNIKNIIENTYGLDVANDAISTITTNEKNYNNEPLILVTPKLYFCCDWSDLTNTYTEIHECEGRSFNANFEIYGDDKGVHFKIDNVNDEYKTVEIAENKSKFFLRKQDLIDYYEKKKLMAKKKQVITFENESLYKKIKENPKEDNTKSNTFSLKELWNRLFKS